MANQLGATGLITSTRTELVDYYTEQFQLIYGPDVNLASDTPDGQMLNIFVQSVLDLEDLLTSIYNNFNPDTATGVILDQRVAINGIQRRAGTYTITNVTVVSTQSVNLYGLDQDVEDIYTVSDNANNRWLLETTQLALTPGTNVLVFRAENTGANLTVPNTITTQVSIVLGVASVNNPTTYTTLGVDEETDAELRVRRQKSVSISSQGYLDGLLAALLNVDGVTSAFVYENVTGAADADGVPGHSIWVIVAGSAASADIADAIYTKRNAGCGMKGSTTYNVVQRDGTSFTIRWDNVTSEAVFIQFTATRITGSDPINTTGIKAYLVANYVPGVDETVNINTLASYVQAYDSNVLITLAGFSTTFAGSYTNTLAPTTKAYQFVLTTANITIS